MAQNKWEADKIKLHNLVKAFMIEGKVATDPFLHATIDAPGGFLLEWWSIFWDIFIARNTPRLEQQQQLKMQQLQLMQHCNVQLQQRNSNHPALPGTVSAMNSEAMMGQSSAILLALKLYEERMKNAHSVDSEPSTALIDSNRILYLETLGTNQLHVVQQIQSRTPLTTFLHSGLNQGVTGLPLKGWPLTGMDPLCPTLGVQIQKSNMQSQNQFHLASQQDQFLAQAQSQSSIGNSTNYRELDPRRLSQINRVSLNSKDVIRYANLVTIHQLKMTEVQHSPSQQEHIQQQLPQNSNRKTKQHSSSGAANSTVIGTTVSPSPNSPPSIHTSGDGMTTTSGLYHVNSGSKSMMIYGPDGTSLAPSSSMLPSYSLQAYTGHSSPVIALDFRPKKQIFSVLVITTMKFAIGISNHFLVLVCLRYVSGGTAQVRFQPRIGQLLAAASDKVVSIFDGHSEMVNYICWDESADYLATASQTLVKIWSLSSGECIQELNGNQFHSCVFHPSYATLLVIGGISSLELWNKCMTTPAHENIISGLALEWLLASASHDCSVKLWK
ncbi:hypothetical protein K2173_017294 [Erythroxylum novogranatense]|uniref:Transcriptional corepressor LEUNIG n=1 Tax=Erythroxylum novogranatense TaxID=1862640 RepID=A0AAV8UD56_9ROSI|nr:hypothetical protein K2173_017294 [Erythroxylum novogranatense]